MRGRLLIQPPKLNWMPGPKHYDHQKASYRRLALDESSFKIVCLVCLIGLGLYR